MLKVKSNEEKILDEFSGRFRDIEEVKAKFSERQNPDETLIAILKEYEERGQKGYEISSRFFEWFRNNFPKEFSIEGPERAGKDVDLQDVLTDYPKSRPTDFLIRYKEAPIAVGYIRYDSDRGGAQEDDRTGGYNNVVKEIQDYSKNKDIKQKILFVNDGPGLLLGSMWSDYSQIEKNGGELTRVVTLKMLDSRVTGDWLLS